MSTCYKLRKGLDIPLKGQAAMFVDPPVSGTLYELKPADFKNVIPKLLVHEGDAVLAGSPVYCDKAYPEIVFTAPVSGTVSSIVRGEKRKLTGIRIVPDNKNNKAVFRLAHRKILLREA